MHPLLGLCAREIQLVMRGTASRLPDEPAHLMLMAAPRRGLVPVAQDGLPRITRRE